MNVNINQVTLGGRLTHDPEAFHFKDGSGRRVAKLRLAVTHTFGKGREREGQKSAFITVKVFDGQARRLATWVMERLGKGDPLLVEGKLLTESWRAQDGSPRSMLILTADNVHFLTERPVQKVAPQEEDETPPEFFNGENSPEELADLGL